MEPACVRINGPLLHASADLLSEIGAGKFPLAGYGSPSALSVLELKNNGSSNFPADALRRARKNQRNVRRTGQTL